MSNKEMLAKLAKLLETLSEEEIDALLETESPKKKKKARHRNKNKQEEPSKKSKNKFDDMLKNITFTRAEQKELSKATEDDVEVRNNIGIFSKTARKNSKIDMRCRSCGKDFKVSASLVFDKNRWRCNTCSCSAGD
jgi:hypothetical protein